ncbi:MAG: M3 family metallopeptidase [Saprospiraceae bacterium]|nr:M3 family metallopeptidase [Saprospiraceae bacterium]
MKTILVVITLTLHVAAFAQTAAPKDNVLTKEFKTPFGTVPFDKITPDDFMPAMTQAMKDGRAEVQKITDNKAKPSFNNTVISLEQSGKSITRISKVLFNLNSAETNPAIQKNVRDISPLLTEYNNDISLNEKLFARIKSVYNKKDKLKLDKESYILLDKTYKRFSRNGANLTPDKKDQLRAINKELSDLSIKFSENVLNETNDYSKQITDETQLSGLPVFVKEAAASAAKKAGKEGWLFSLQAPSYGPFMQYADNRGLREELFKAFNSRCAKGNKNDNNAIIEKVVQLRYNKAQLLGYNTWADYILEERMANTTTIVMDFLEDVRQYAEPAADRELKELMSFAKSQGFADDRLQRWDFAYYAEKLKKEKFNINDEILKPYFKLENVLNGLFDVTNRLFGLTFKQNKEIKTWHQDVVAYEVYDASGKLMAIWYGDYFPRPGKRAGAWNNTLRSQWVENGKEYRPHVVNVCNFSKPTETKPSLLTFGEVEILYHEFGHALHDMLAQGKYASISGTSVAWDFVELPSQLMENFVSEKEVLKLFAKHYETGEVIPDDLINKIRESANFMAATATLRQLGLGLIDMSWHSTIPSGKSVAEVEKQADITHKLYPETSGYSVSTAFSHIFAGGYSAGYYSYKWSEVLDADAFDLFKEKGIFNKDVSASFRNNILSKGGSEKPLELYKKFRGREPKPEAMLKRSGLLITP